MQDGKVDIIILEDVASEDLLIGHSFGSPSSHNDLNVLSRSQMFARLVVGDAPSCNTNVGVEFLDLNASVGSSLSENGYGRCSFVLVALSESRWCGWGIYSHQI